MLERNRWWDERHERKDDIVYKQHRARTWHLLLQQGLLSRGLYSYILIQRNQPLRLYVIRSVGQSTYATQYGYYRNHQGTT